MRISARTEYAVLALMKLAQHVDLHPMRAKDIAESADIPKAFLDQLLLDLRRAGLIRSIRGPGGGFALANHPENILLHDIILAVDSTALCSACGIKTADGSPCTLPAYCALREVWQQVDEAAERVLQGITLATLVDHQSELEGHTMFYI